jgi:alkylhydroperoxidase family enzyme
VKPVSRYPGSDIASMPPDMRERILAVQEKAGLRSERFPRARAPSAEWRAFFAYHDALMEKEGGLTKGRARDDRGRDLGREPVRVLRRGARGDPADPREESARGGPGGGQLPQGRHHAEAEGDARFRDEGLARGAPRRGRRLRAPARRRFTDEDIWDIAAISALFALSNRMASFTNMRPNEEFYLMGRTARP